MTLRNWRAKRSGGSITVHGETADGTPKKLTRVTALRVQRGEIVATTADGLDHQLANK